MKNRWVGGWVALLGLWGGILTVDVGAQEGATPDARLALPEDTTITAQLCRCEGDEGSSGQRIRQALAGPLKSTGLEFTKVPLKHVVRFLQDEYDIPIQLDQVALEDAGLTVDEPVTVTVRNTSLRSALRILLKSIFLTYVVRDEVLVITTPMEAEAELIACVYDVRDLIGRNRDNKNLRELADLISSVIATETWEINGKGVAEIRTLQLGLLVIAQTEAVHEQIRGLLSLIRETLKQPAHESHVLTPEQMREMAMGMEGMGDAGMDATSGEMGMEEEPASQPEPTPADKDPFD